MDSIGREYSPDRLLERAAALESVDMRHALALYQQIALNHTGTRAAKEASRNVEILLAAHPELQDSLSLRMSLEGGKG
jgi:hypothetical protein